MGYCGLINLGNTCYQNSFLQSLFMTKTLRHRLLSASLVPHPRQDEKIRRKAEEERKTADKAIAEDKDKAAQIKEREQQEKSFKENKEAAKQRCVRSQSPLSPPN